MTVSITDFPSLLEAAAMQPEPQRLLFVFLQVSLPKDASVEEAERFAKGQGGQLVPIICTDKALEELKDFPTLVAESEQMGEPWDLVLVAALSGEDGKMPTSDDAEEPLKVIANDVVTGGDLSAYLAFNREGKPVVFG